MNDLKSAAELLCEHCTPSFSDDANLESLVADLVPIDLFSCGEIARLGRLGMRFRYLVKTGGTLLTSITHYGKADEANRYVDLCLAGMKND